MASKRTITDRQETLLKLKFGITATELLKEINNAGLDSFNFHEPLVKQYWEAVDKETEYLTEISMGDWFDNQAAIGQLNAVQTVSRMHELIEEIRARDSYASQLLHVDKVINQYYCFGTNLNGQVIVKDYNDKDLGYVKIVPTEDKIGDLAMALRKLISDNDTSKYKS